MVQKITRALFGSFSGGRSTMAEYSARWLGMSGSATEALHGWRGGDAPYPSQAAPGKSMGEGSARPCQRQPRAAADQADAADARDQPHAALRHQVARATRGQRIGAVGERRN